MRPIGLSEAFLFCAGVVIAPALRAQAPPGAHVVERSKLPSNIATAITQSTAHVVPAQAATVIAHPPAGAAVESTRVVRSPVATVIPPTAPTVTIKPGEFVAVKVSGPPLLIAQRRVSGQANFALDSFVALPERFVGVAVDSDLAFLRPAFLPQGQLRYDATTEYFRGGFSIGLEDSVRRTEQRKLTGGFHFQFGGSDVDSVTPGGLDIDHTNLPLTAVTVLARNPADSVQLSIITAADVRGTTVWLRAVPALAFGRLHPAAQGFGLERIPILVSVLGTRRKTPMQVTITADHGSVAPQVITLGTGKDTTVVWTTGSVGTATIQATADAIGADAVSATVNFAIPIIFLLAAILGGAAGAALKLLQGGDQGKSLGRVMVTGILAGVLAAGIYCAINVSILPVPVNVPFFNEGAVFALAALAGLLGVKLGADKTEKAG